MTAEQVIKVIETEKTCVQRNIKGCNRDCRHCDLVMPDKDVIEGYNMAILALEKQIPHKLAPKQSGNSEIPVCGKCNSIMDLMQGELNYCPNCGQALDL